MGTPTADRTEPPRLEGFWLCFTLDHDEGQAAEIYKKRHGQPPTYIVEHLGLLRLGPVDGPPQAGG